MRTTKALWMIVAAIFVVGGALAIWGPGPERKPEVKARIIAVKADASDPEDIKRAREKIQETYDFLRKGASFEQLARNRSEADSARDGGDMGWIGRGTLSADLEEVVFSLKPGEFSEILEQKRAEDIVYRILYVEQRRHF
ncbi:MAG: hypothetical protein Kow0099_09800 [Candidatus Abyssubacteria bacterium]